jgi:hypothetical protein
MKTWEWPGDEASVKTHRQSYLAYVLKTSFILHLSKSLFFGSTGKALVKMSGEDEKPQQILELDPSTDLEFKGGH